MNVRSTIFYDEPLTAEIGAVSDDLGSVAEALKLKKNTTKRHCRCLVYCPPILVYDFIRSIREW